MISSSSLFGWIWFSTIANASIKTLTPLSMTRREGYKA